MSSQTMQIGKKKFRHVPISKKKAAESESTGATAAQKLHGRDEKPRSKSNLMKTMKKQFKKQQEEQAQQEEAGEDDEEEFAAANEDDQNIDEENGPSSTNNPDLLGGEENKEVTFSSLGLCKELCDACTTAGWKHPTRIQAAGVPAALSGKDCVGVAQTGSGKTGAYVLPLVQWLLNQHPKVPYNACLILVPTRELALQVQTQFQMLGASVGLRVVSLLGGVDMVTQACELSRKPHVIVGTPGRIKDHLANTKGFNMIKLKHLVMDEADKMLDMDYERELDAILEYLPRTRQTMLFSATLSTKVDRLQKASLKDPVLLEVHRKNTTVSTLQQLYIFTPFTQMSAQLHIFLTQEAGTSIIIFCNSANLVQKLCIVLRTLGHRALPMMGKMSQENRNKALAKFKAGGVRCLVCTDVAQRGLDIPSVDVVINYSMPQAVSDYIHRVGRTARAGSSGKAVSIISQYDIVQLQNVEAATGVKMTEVPLSQQDVDGALQRVEDAEQEAHREIKEHELDEKLEKEQQREGTSRAAKRTRSEAMGYDDGQHGKGDFSMLRMRRENEELFSMTKNDRYKSFHQKRRESKKGGGGKK